MFRTLTGVPLHARGAVVALMVCRKLLAEVRTPACQALLRDVNGIGAGHVARICAELESLRLRLRNYIAVSPRCGTAEQWAGGVANVEAVQSRAWCAEGAAAALLTLPGARAPTPGMPPAPLEREHIAAVVHRILRDLSLISSQLFLLADGLPMFREPGFEERLSAVLAATLAEHRTKVSERRAHSIGRLLFQALTSPRNRRAALSRASSPARRRLLRTDRTQMIVARRVGSVLEKLEAAKGVARRRSAGAVPPVLSPELAAARAALASVAPLLADLPDARWRSALSEQHALLRAQLS